MKILLIATAFAALCFVGCGPKRQVDAAQEDPPKAQVVEQTDLNVVTVADSSHFPSVTATAIKAAPELSVTGSVTPDVSRQVPVISLASGRVVEIHARLGDLVHKGQLLLRIQSSDISDAFADYQKAVADEKLADAQLTRSRDLFNHGALAAKDLEVAENNENDAKVAVTSAVEKLKVLGADPQHVATIVDVRAPITGYVTEQNVASAAGVKSLDNSPNLFTISDLSQVWIICDVYENDLSFVKLGQFADVRVAGYPELALKGRISDIGPVLDPNIRTAKIRLQLANPGVLRVGQFVTAAFHGLARETHAVVPAAAILHLHDRDWVYVPSGPNRFRRTEVSSGAILPGNMQELNAGLSPGDRVVGRALVLENTVEQ